MPDLLGLDVLIVDCQTTGATPLLGEVLEIGWCLTRANDTTPEQIESHWIALPEGHRVSSQVRQLTGFDDVCLREAITAAEAWSRLRAVTRQRERVHAAMHFARFELKFLRDWSSRFEPERAFPLDAVCVHAIACRLYPDLPRRSIRALAGFLGHGVDLSRRAAGHVEATAFIWRKLSHELGRQNINTWQELQAWLETPLPKRKASYPLPKTRYRSLPDEPGVYRFLRSNGDVLYVGKATSLRKRVTSHFAARARANERALEMLTQVADVRFTSTPTALEAALLESDEIKRLSPQYNIHLAERDRAIMFASRDFASLVTAPDDEHRTGPLPSAYSLRPLSALLALLSEKAHTPWLRSAAVGAVELWAPDPETFTAGFELFSQRHLSDPSPFQHCSARHRTLNLAKRLFEFVRADSAASDGEDNEPPVDAPRGWDPERVCRHLERAAAQAYQLLRRASVLCILSRSAICYREPGKPPRLIVLSDGEFVEMQDADAMPMHGDERRGEFLQVLPTRPWRVLQANFNKAVYDRLRILVTELKRILRDGGSVTIRVHNGRLLSGEGTRRLLSRV